LSESLINVNLAKA